MMTQFLVETPCFPLLGDVRYIEDITIRNDQRHDQNDFVLSIVVNQELKQFLYIIDDNN